MPAKSDAAHPLLDKLDQQIAKATSGWAYDPDDYPAALAILKLPASDRPAILLPLLHAFKDTYHAKLNFQHVDPNKLNPTTRDFIKVHVLGELISQLIRQKLPLTDQLIDPLTENAALDDPGILIKLSPVIRAVEEFTQSSPLSPTTKTNLKKLRSRINSAYKSHTHTKEFAKFIERLDHLLSDEPAAGPAPKRLDTGEPWAAAAQDDTASLKPDAAIKWSALLLHLQSADGSKPTQKWLKQTATLLDAFGRPRFRSFLTRWLPLTPQNRSSPPPDMRHEEEMLLFSDASTLTLKGLAWAASLFPEPDVALALGDLGESCWKKIRNVGPRSKLVGNAVLWALSAIGTNDAIAQLTRINSKLKHRSARTLAAKALNRVAESTGQSREDLEEIAIPTFNLSPDGILSQKIADYTATLAITPNYTAELTLTDSQGKTKKSIPAALKSNPALKSLQKTHKQLNNILKSQRLRIESILRLPDRRWSFHDWQSRYLHHPLIAPLARRLIWQFTTGPNSPPVAAMFINNQFLSANGTPLKSIGNGQSATGISVQLWHPCTDTPQKVLAWRTFLERHQITQPFKQAHREIYLLTDAERRTRTYSNRFAAHILRQHQFTALCAARGWNYRLQGTWDGGGATPTLDLPNLNVRVEFWVEAVAINNDDLSQTGVALHLSTDQVRFHQLQPLKQLRVDQIPAQLFSEILRDVDLFVGVCSVGNDPAWADGGPNGRYRDYWQSVSFGDLTESAKTRKTVLQSLLPRLNIAPQCSLSDKFLTVKGKLRTYKIHLGSGNILMEPNDQYLCIVAGRGDSKSQPSNLYLPFEGDSTLSLILSKAFLLANDTQISDPTITRQIKP